MAERTIVTRVANAVLYSNGSIRIDNVRFSFPHISEPYESTGDDGKVKKQYSVTAMLPKSSHVAAKNLVKESIEKLQSEKNVKVSQAFWFLADGDKVADEDDRKEIYRGHFLVKCADSRRPSARKRNGEQMSDGERETEFYGGMWGSVLIRPWYFDGKARNGKTYPKRILSNFIAAQKLCDDESFGEGRISDDGVFEADDSSDEGDDGL